MHDLKSLKHILQRWSIHAPIVTWHPMHEKGNVVLLTTTTGTYYIL